MSSRVSRPTHRSVPVVYLLGGSAARECTVSDTSWAAQVLQRGGPTVLTFNLGSIHQSFREDLTLVPTLPAIPSITFIGLNFGRFTSTAGPTRAERYTQHHYSIRHILSNAKKRWLVTDWLKRRYPVFKARFSYGLSLLDQLIAACQQSDLHPVLLELPLNLQIVGHAFDAPRAQIRSACQALAKKYQIPYLDFVQKAGMVSGGLLRPRASRRAGAGQVSAAALRSVGRSTQAVWDGREQPMSRRSCTLRAATLPVVAALLVAAVLVGMQWLQHRPRARDHRSERRLSA